jgi:hypothetical protein
VGARFSAHVASALEPTKPPIHWASGHFPGGKRPGCDVDHPPPSSAEVKERVELYLYFPSGLSWPVLGVSFTFTVTCSNTRTTDWIWSQLFLGVMVVGGEGVAEIY